MRTSLAAISLWVLLALSACAKIGITPGTIGGGNDPAPTTGAIVAQGTFTTESGAAVSGVVTVYSNPDGGSILRLAGLSVPSSDPGVQIIPYVGSGQQAAIPLTYYTGATNYPLSYGAAGWSQVTLREPANNVDVAVALLTQQ